MPGIRHDVTLNYSFPSHFFLMPGTREAKKSIPEMCCYDMMVVVGYKWIHQYRWSADDFLIPRESHPEL